VLRVRDQGAQEGHARPRAPAQAPRRARLRNQARGSHDGLHGSFTPLNDADGDKALELIRAGVLGGVSAEFLPLKSRTRSDGVVERQQVRLEKVALCRQGAYGDAKVLAVRGLEVAAA
jgi:HK97 family phage prohead protease